jgi:plastocyanin
MKIETTLRKALPLFAVLVLTLLSFRSAPAATHTITFGGDFQYTPSQLSVAVGDVITWQGDFSFHPLQFDAVPAGAVKPENVTSGNTFSYTVEVAGEYRYHCTLHGSANGSGMAGAFTAGTASVDRPVDVAMLRSFPNPVHQDSPLTVELGFDASMIKNVSITTSDGITGNFILGAGYFVDGNTVTIPNTSWGAGAFVISISTTDGNIYRRKVIITR